MTLVKLLHTHQLFRVGHSFSLRSQVTDTKQVIVELWTIGSLDMRDVIYIYMAFKLTH